MTLLIYLIFSEIVRYSFLLYSKPRKRNQTPITTSEMEIGALGASVYGGKLLKKSFSLYTPLQITEVNLLEGKITFHVTIDICFMFFTGPLSPTPLNLPLPQIGHFL